MNEYTATEQAYENGYEAGKRDAVKHGKWVKYKDNGYVICSNCKATKPFLTKLFDGISEKDPEKVIYWVCRHCPNCGANMDMKGETEG